MRDNTYKAYLVSSGLYSVFLEFRNYFYKTYSSDPAIDLSLFTQFVEGTLFSVRFMTFYDDVRSKFPLLFEDLKVYFECVKLYNANRQLYRRLKKRVTSMIQKPCLFLTIDFSPEDLSSTTEKERRRIVCEYLKENTNNYVANIDFGELKGREHYHAIIQSDFVDIHSWKLSGWVKYEHVRANTCSAERLSHYITKMTRHALKHSTKRYNVIYSRGCA